MDIRDLETGQLRMVLGTREVQNRVKDTLALHEYLEHFEYPGQDVVVTDNF